MNDTIADRSGNILSIQPNKRFNRIAFALPMVANDIAQPARLNGTLLDFM